MNTWDILKRIGFGEEALHALAEAEQAVSQSELWNGELAISLSQQPDARWQDIMDSLTALGQSSGQPPQVLHLLYLARNLPALYDEYRARGIAEEYFYDAASDLTFKLAECMERFGVYGTASFLWHIPFYHLQRRRFSLGRLTYEDRVYPGPEHTCAGFTVREGDKLLGLHIPSGSSFGREKRMDSYRKAFQFYGCTREKPLIVHCNSWLLNPDHRDMLPPTSNIVDFMDDFDPVGDWERDHFPDAWRVFGRAASQPMETWPADNALRRGYIALLSAGKKARNGHGLLIFDGEKLLTGKRHA